MAEGRFIIKIPANIYLGIEKVPIMTRTVGLARMQEVIGGNIEALHLLDSEFNVHCMEEGWSIDAFGLHDGRCAKVVPANMRATQLLGYPRTVMGCLVGDIVLTAYDDEGETLPLPEPLWAWFTEQMSDPIPGLL